MWRIQPEPVSEFGLITADILEPVGVCRAVGLLVNAVEHVLPEPLDRVTLWLKQNILSKYPIYANSHYCILCGRKVAWNIHFNSRKYKDAWQSVNRSKREN